MKNFKNKFNNKNSSPAENNFAVMPKFKTDYLKNKIHQINSNILPEGFFEKIAMKLFKNIYQKRAQKTALNKFSEINEIALQLSKKKN